MSSTTIISGNAQKSNSGAIAYGGNVGTLVTSVDYNELQARPFQANVVPSNMTGAAPSGIGTTIVSGGTYAGMVAGRYVGIGYNDLLANSVAAPTTVGASVNSDRVSIMSSTGLYTIDYTDWSYMSGIASYTNSLTYFSEDNAAAPTRTVPGELTYLSTGATPTNKDYSVKNT